MIKVKKKKRLRMIKQKGLGKATWQTFVEPLDVYILGLTLIGLTFYYGIRAG